MSTDLVVLLHGLGQGPLAWEDVVVALPRDVQIEAPWLVGIRAGDQREFTLEGAINQVSDLITASGAQRVYLVGLSLGAMVAIGVAAHDSRVAGLVVSGAQVKVPRWVMGLQNALMKVMPSRTLAEQGVSKESMRQAMAQLVAVDLRPLLPQVAAPTLVIQPSKDRANDRAGAIIAASIPGAQVAVIEGGGHEVNRTHGAAFAAQVTSFLQAQRERPPGA